MECVGVVGAGTMGAGIAEVAARGGARVLLHDSDPTQVGRGLAALRASLGRAVERGKASRAEADAAIARVEPAAALYGFAGCALVIEAVAERLEVKREVFRALDATCPPPALLASNTSSLPVGELAAVTTHPERVLGLHFFNPAPILPLVEVVQPPRAAAEAVERARVTMQAWGKRPIVVADTPGFVVNRVARPFYLEALRGIGDGYAGCAEVDAALRAVGFRMGPFQLIDLVGVDVNLAVSQSVYAQTYQQPRFRPHPLQEQMVRAGLLGRKAGRGFYDYSTDPHAPVCPARAPITPPSGPWAEWADGEPAGFIVGRVLACLINEAYHAVGEGVASREDVDLAMRLGTNWPRGPFEWAAERGPGLVRRTLEALRQAHGDAYLPAPLLAQDTRG